MKLLLSLLIASSIATAATVEDAKNLYSKRGENKENALEAAKIFGELASKEANDVKKSSYLISKSEAIYFYSNRVNSKKEKIKYYTQGYETALTAANLVASEPGVAKSEDLKTQLSRAYYFYSANLGKWGEAKGVLNSLSKWPTLKKHLNYIRKNDDTVEDYGAYRILGRAYIKVPFESNNQGLKFLEKAYNSTKASDEVGIDISKNITNVNYYLFALIENDEDNTYCEVYERFQDLSDAGQETWNKLHPNMIPETTDGIKEISSDKDYTEYYDDNC